MAVNIGQATSRGTAGQTGMTRRGAYNFSNLYNLNRATDQTGRQVSKIGGDLRQAQTDVDRYGRQGFQAARQGNKQGVNNANSGIASAIDSARGNDAAAKSFDPSVSAMKSGASAYQAGVADFYAGGAQAKQNARKFSGIFDSIRGTGESIQSRLPGMLAQGQQDRQTAYDKEQGRQREARNKLHEARYNAYDESLDKGPDREVRRMDNLSWMLRTGRISADEMYRAQKDEEYFNYLMQKFQ